MKNFCLLIIFVIVGLNSNAQKNCNLKSKYGIIFDNSQKTEDACFVSFYYNSLDNQSKKKKFFFRSPVRMSGKETYNVYLQDSLNGDFLIDTVLEKQNNYIVINDSIINIPIFMAFVTLINDSIKTDHIVLLFYDIKIAETLKKKQNVKLNINPIFKVDCCKHLANNQIVKNISGFPLYESFLFQNIWIVNIDTGYNYYTIKQINPIFE